MAYNTNNPVGSTDPRDLFDNAGNMDKFENGPNPFYPDRFGVQKLSRSGMIENFNNMIAGQEAAFQQFLNDSGFVSLGNYAAGLNFTLYNQYMARDGFFYRPAPSSIPFTTTGTWVGGDENLFNLFSADDVLRQDLASATDPAKGAAIVANAVARIASISQLSARPRPTVETTVIVDEAGLSGIFRWISSSLASSVLDANNQAFIPAAGMDISIGGWSRLSGCINSPVTILVGAGSYFTTLNQALDFVSDWAMAGDGRVVTRLLSGYVMREQVVLHQGRDLSFVEVTSEDEEVIVDRGFINTPTPGGIILVDGSFQAFGPALFSATEQSKLPVIGTKFRFNTSGGVSGGRVGIRVAYGSSVLVRRNCGVLDSPTEGLTAIHGSHAVAAGALFSGAGSNGVTSYRGSFIDFRNGVADDCGGRGAYIGSNSRLEALNASFKNAGSDGIEAYGASIAHVRGADFSGAGAIGLFARDGAVISTRGSNIDNCGSDGIQTLNGGRVYAEGSTIRNAGRDAVYCGEGGFVNLQAGIIEAARRHGLFANRGSEITAEGVTISGCGGSGVHALKVSSVNASASTIRGCAGDGVHAESGSRVSVASVSTISNMGLDLLYASGAGTSIDAGGAILAASGSGNQRVYAEHGATLNIERGVATGTPSRTVVAYAAATINADSAQLGAGAVQGTVLASRASTINISNAAVGAPSSSSAITVGQGATICAVGTGSATTNIAVNTLTGSGIIYR